MLREEKNALILLLLFVIGALGLYLFVLKPALNEVIEPRPAMGPTPSEEVAAIDVQLEQRPKSAKRMLTVRAHLRDAATGIALSQVKTLVRGVEDIAEPLAREATDGAILVEYLPAEVQFSVEFSASGYETRSIPALRGGEKETIELGVVTLSPIRAIRGEARDREGRPIPNLKVGAFVVREATPTDDTFERARRLAEALRGAVAAATETDANGRFELPNLEPADYVIHFLAEGFAPIALPGIDLTYGDGDARVVLERAPKARARLDLDDGRAPKNTLVTLIAATVPTDIPLSCALTTASDDGIIAVKTLLPEPHFVFVGGGGAATCGIGPVLLPSDHEIRITVPRGATAHGTVLDAHGVAVKGARVEIGGAHRGALRAVTGTDIDGNWTLTDLPVGAARVRISAKGFATDEQSVPIASFGAEHRVRLFSGGTLTGKITSEGKPVLGARVILPEQGLRAVTDTQGSFRIEGLSAGKARVEVQAVGFAELERTVEVVLGRDVSLDAALERGGEVRIRVHDGADAPLEGARIAVLPVDEHDNPRIADVRFVSTDAQGLARCRDLENGLRLALIASKRGYSPARSESFVLGPEHQKRGFALTLEPGVSVAGLTRDDQGKPIAYARVRAESLLENPLERWLVERAAAHSVSDAEGRYELSDLPVGEYRLVVEALGYRRTATDKVALAQGARRTGLDIELLPSRPLFGTVQTADSRPIPMARVTLISAGPLAQQVELATDYAGRFYFLTPDARPFVLEALEPYLGRGEIKIETDDQQPPFAIVIQPE